MIIWFFKKHPVRLVLLLALLIGVPLLASAAVHEPSVPVFDDPRKTVNGQEQVELEDLCEEFTYALTQKIPDGATGIVFSDVLEDCLEFVERGDVSGSNNYQWTIDGQTVSVSILDANQNEGSDVTVTFKARIKNGVSSADIITAYGTREIPMRQPLTYFGKKIMSGCQRTV